MVIDSYLILYLLDKQNVNISNSRILKVGSHLQFFAPFLSTAPLMFLKVGVNSTIEMHSAHFK